MPSIFSLRAWARADRGAVPAGLLIVALASTGCSTHGGAGSVADADAQDSSDADDGGDTDTGAEVEPADGDAETEPDAGADAAGDTGATPPVVEWPGELPCDLSQEPPGVADYKRYLAEWTWLRRGLQYRCGEYAFDPLADEAAQVLAEEVCAHEVPIGLRTGRQRFDASAAERCLVQARAETCAEFSDTLCDPIVGSVALDGACYVTEECARGLYCESSECPGHCRPRTPIGEVGTTSAPCVEDTSQGRDGTCYALLTEGEMCPTPARAILCGPGLVCSDDNNICVGVRIGPPGGLCGETRRCALGADCIGARCAPLAGLGETCGSGAPCQRDLTCQGTCVAQPSVLAPGEACSQFSALPCEPGLVCRFDADGSAMGACGAPAEEGEFCNSPAQCASDLKCVGQACAPPVAEGGDCYQGSDCAAGLFCEGRTDATLQGTCALTKPYQAACEQHDECEAGYCNLRTCWCIEPLP